MKKYYKINEIAKLYNIKTDSLRYYEEVGLICPIRSKSNYRLYTLNDIYILNIIRDCLKLGYDTHQIKEYLDNRSVNNTIVFLKEEERLIQRQIQELNTTLSSIQTRIEDLNRTQYIEFDTCKIEVYPKRYCRYLKEKIDQDEKIDFLLTKLSESMEEDISVLGNMDSGSVVEYKNNEYVYTSVFILTQEEKHDFILDEGMYCTYTYSGEMFMCYFVQLRIAKVKRLHKPWTSSTWITTMTTLKLDTLSDRIKAHKNALVHIVKPPVCTERAQHYTEMYQQHLDKPIAGA